MGHFHIALLEVKHKYQAILNIVSVYVQAIFDLKNICLTVISYLFFNVAVWLAIGEGGLPALAAANIAGGLITAVFKRKEIISDKRGKMPKWHISLLGAFGIVAIVHGLRGAHTALPVSISMEMVYNSFAVLSWPMFAGLYMKWSKHFEEKPNFFDGKCHVIMAIFVLLRIRDYGLNFSEVAAASWWVGLAVLGYMLFNVSIKLASLHRITNVFMNLIGGALLLIWSFASSEFFGGYWWSFRHVSGAVLGGLAIFGIVTFLGASYNDFGKKGLSSLVAPLVYDGILIASPLVQICIGTIAIFSAESAGMYLIAFGMLAVTSVRYQVRHVFKELEALKASAQPARVV